MKKVLILLIPFVLSACFFKIKTKQVNEYPYLVESIETFFNNNYCYPKNLEELKDHIKENTKFDITYKKLNQNNTLSLINHTNKVIIIDFSINDTVAEVYKFDFCKRLENKNFPRFYLEDWAVYRKGRTLKTNDIDSLKLKRVKQKIKDFSEQDLSPYHRKYDFIRFVNDSLIFKCTQKNNAINKDSINYYLENFSSENKIDSIYFFSSIKQ